MYGRFDYLLNELDKRYKTNHLSARTPETLFLEEIDKEREQLEALRNATQTAIVALDDWVNIYAEELCCAERVAIAKAHVAEHGLLWYVATVLEQCKDALKERNE